MIIKASAALRNEYSEISKLAKDTKEPIFITKNGEGDLVVMDIETFERREQLFKLRASVLRAEQERVEGAPVLTIDEAKKKLQERAYVQS